MTQPFTREGDLVSDAALVGVIVLPVVISCASVALPRWMFVLWAVLPIVYAQIPFLFARWRGRLVRAPDPSLRAVLTVVRYCVGAVFAVFVLAAGLAGELYIVGAIAIPAANLIAFAWGWSLIAVEGLLGRRPRATSQDSDELLPWSTKESA